MPDPAELLIGREILCSVSEPWNFEFDTGQNSAIGIIQTIETFYGRATCALCAVPTFLFEGREIAQVIATLRYPREIGLVSGLLLRRRLDCNLVFDRSGARLGPDQAARFLEGNSKSRFLIGAIALR